MADQSPTPESLVAELLELKRRAEEATEAAEDANRKANSESAYAFNAKGNAEEHAKAIAQVRGTVEADFAWLTTTTKNADDIAQGIAQTKAAADADGRAISEARAASERDIAAASAATMARRKPKQRPRVLTLLPPLLSRRLTRPTRPRHNKPGKCDYGRQTPYRNFRGSNASYR